MMIRKRLAAMQRHILAEHVGHAVSVTTLLGAGSSAPLEKASKVLFLMLH
jgi:hypothetical protein